MATANDLRKGNAIRREGELYLVLDLQRVKPGKGGAFVQTTIRNLRTGRTAQIRFSSTETVEIVLLVKRKLEYSYRDGADFVFIDPETFEQIVLGGKLYAPAKDFIVEGNIYNIVFAGDDTPLEIELPASVDLKVTEAPEWVKGDSATNLRKPIKLETGLELNAPLFIKEGEVIKVDTRTGEYIGRA